MFNADALRTAREAKGLGVEELAVQVGVSRQSVWSWERGKTAPGMRTGLRLSAFLEVPLAALYVHEGEAATASISRG